MRKMKKAHTFLGYDRPDIGNQAWIELGIYEEALSKLNKPNVLPTVRKYLAYLEDELREATRD